MKLYFSLYETIYNKNVCNIHESVFILYETMYNNNIHLLLYKEVYNNNKYFYYIREYIMTINIFVIHESVYRYIRNDV